MKFSKIAIAACAFAAAIGSAPAAFGATETIVLGHSLTAGFASQDMAHLKIDQVGADTVWTLKADWNNSLNGTSPFVFDLEFSNTKHAAPVSFSPLDGSTIGLANHGLSATAVKFQPGNNNNGRFTDGESATWTFTNTTLNDFSNFQLHVNALTNNQSVKFTQYVTPVPEPETYGMLLAGLGLVGFAARRRAAK
ncbi:MULTISPECIES: FxDxF family PEP-CTERM protein [unclassified Duganella]|uniref:FxDxF family PEP-CTERM protein n=1 Tax=unclassified Duganella TaxID=2636909 RepID=UPI001313DBDB|nr:MULTISPECIES: FxDxF family PEP-CTERM protein [unclassified Duganella]